MPSIFLALNTANSALQADQASIETISHNVANTSTNGYSQQTANLVASPAYTIPSQNRAAGPGQIGTGVTVQGITRARDALLDGQFRYQNQLAGQWSTLDTQFGQVQGILPEPASTGLGQKLSAFWTSWQSVADDPSNMGARATVQQAGITLATTFNNDAQQIAQAQHTADAAVQSNVTTINNAASQIANLNGQIASVLATGQQPNDLLDQRDLLIDTISNTVPITTTAQPNGMVTINLATSVPGSTTLQVARPSAAPLVSGVTTNLLQFTAMAVPTYTSTAAGTETMTTGGAYTGTSQVAYIVKVTGLAGTTPNAVSYSVDGGKTFVASASVGSPFTLSNGLTASLTAGAVVGDQFSFSASPTSVSAVTGAPLVDPSALSPVNATTNPLGGQLGANVQVRDVILGGPSGLLAQLNTLAQQIALKVNTLHAGGYDLTGATGNPFFNASGPPYNTAASVANVTATNITVTPAIANNVQLVAAAAAPNAVGDGAVAQSIANINGITGAVTDPLPNVTIQQGYEGIISALGANAKEAHDSNSNQTVVMTTLTNQRQSIGGVSQDAQMTMLVEFQNSYAAAARIVTTVDSMLNTIIHMGLGN